MQTKIDFLRHGEPVGGQRYRGHGVDDVLSEKGWAQMNEGVGLFRSWDHIVASPLLRCADFAQKVSDEEQLPLSVDPELREIGFGAWEGKTKAELKETRGEEFRRFYLDPVTHTPEGAEPLPVFFKRVERGIEGLISEYRGKHLLVVAHAGVIRVAIAHALGLDSVNMYRIAVKNGRVSRINYSETGRLVDGVNICL